MDMIDGTTLSDTSIERIAEDLSGMSSELLSCARHAILQLLVQRDGEKALRQATQSDNEYLRKRLERCRESLDIMDEEVRRLRGVLRSMGVEE